MSKQAAGKKAVVKKAPVRTFYLAVQPGMDSELYVGMPKREMEECNECGIKHPSWNSQRGSRMVTELCGDVETALKLQGKDKTGLYRLTVTVDPVEIVTGAVTK